MKARTNHRRLIAVGTGLALVAGGAIGAQTFAGDGEADPGPLPPPGQPVEPPAVPSGSEGDLVAGSDVLIQTGGSTFDETILSKWIPAAGFDPLQGGVGTQNDDLVLSESGSCLRPDTTAAGENTFLKAPVELPDGARIKRVSFYGVDNDPVRDISITLFRQEFTSTFNLFPIPPTINRSNTSVDAFSTSGAPGDTIVSGADNLAELTGTPSSGVIFLNNPSRFHTVQVVLQKSASSNHVLCGVRVDYQVAKSSADPGTVYHPVEPFRAFDSRLASFGALSGLLAPNDTKVIDITDGYDSNGVAIPAQADLVPANATSITYNITVAGQTGPNFVAVTAGDAATFTASAINYTGGGNLANASSVTVAADQTIKVWGGDNTGSAHVIIDVTGYSAPAPPPSNMAN
jgi:hypothetical protein